MGTGGAICFAVQNLQLKDHFLYSMQIHSYQVDLKKYGLPSLLNACQI